MQGLHQFLFILHQVLLKKSTEERPDALFYQIGALRWRCVTIARHAITALPFYLFPAWCLRWRWAGYGLLFIIVGGYGNIKYQIVTLLLMFPIRYDTD